MSPTDRETWPREAIIEFVSGLPGAVAFTPDETSGAPEVAWGDSFFFHDPDGDPANRRLPFATIVIKDYPGADTFSDLDRRGGFRLNVGVGREAFRRLLGYPPAEHGTRAAGIDYTARDEVLPHPLYAAQAWVSIVNPGARTAGLARELLRAAHAREVARRRAPAAGGA